MLIKLNSSIELKKINENQVIPPFTSLVSLILILGFIDLPWNCPKSEMGNKNFLNGGGVLFPQSSGGLSDFVYYYFYSIKNDELKQ